MPLSYDPDMPRFDAPTPPTISAPSTPCGLPVPRLPSLGFPTPPLLPADLFDPAKLLALLGLSVPIVEPLTACPAVTEAALAAAVAAWAASR